MKWKLTGQFLVAVLSIVTIVIVTNIIILLVLFSQQAREKVDTNERTALRLADQMTLNGDQVELSETGLDMLASSNAWLQFLDADGNVVSSIDTPEDVRTKYSPYDLIVDYKYQDDSFTTIYVSRFEPYSYIMGVPNSPDSRFITMIDGKSVIEYLTKALIVTAIVDLIIAAIVGLIFGSLITRPIRSLIERIHLLTKEGVTLKKPRFLGIYKPVYNNLVTVNEQLLANEQERKKLEQMRTEWVTNVSHDLKTPLATIRGYAEFLQDDSLSVEERRQYAEIIETRSDYIKELLEDLSLTMRLRNKESVLQLNTIVVEPFIREVVIDVLNDADFEQREIEFSSEITERLTLPIDKRLMKRALLNFIHNAFIHNNSETVVKVLLTEDKLVVTDNGKGITNEDLEQVFDRYYRGSNTENIRGTGLGMAIARDIIEAHGFTISLSSEVGVGTTVTVLF